MSRFSLERGNFQGLGTLEQMRKGGADKDEPKVSPFDGVSRTRAEEWNVNKLMARIDDDAVEYLRSITVNRVCQPDVSTEELRYREGMRGLVAIIDGRRRVANVGEPK